MFFCEREEDSLYNSTGLHLRKNSLFQEAKIVMQAVVVALWLQYDALGFRPPYFCMGCIALWFAFYVSPVDVYSHGLDALAYCGIFALWFSFLPYLNCHDGCSSCALEFLGSLTCGWLMWMHSFLLSIRRHTFPLLEC